MISIYSPCFRESEYVPIVYAYYDRADMLSTTLDEVDHSHNLCEIMYVTEGAACVRVDGRTVALARRQFIFIDAGVRHQLLLDRASPFGMMNIEFQYEPSDGRCPGTRTLAEASPALGRMLSAPAPFMALTDEDGAVHDLLKQIVLLADSTLCDAERMCSLMATQIVLLMARLWRSARLPVRSAHVALALDIIRSRYGGALTALDIARELHIHPTYLHKLFRRETGCSVCEYLQRVRLERAGELLRGGLPLREVAQAVGIASPQYFSKLFKRAYGVTPGEYRLTTRPGGADAPDDIYKESLGP